MTAVTGRPRIRDIPIPAVPAPALRFELTCPDCGGDLEQRAKGVPGRFRTSTLMDCTECTKQWVVAASITEVSKRG